MHLEEEVATLRSRLERLEATVDRLLEGAPVTAAGSVAEGLDHAQLRASLTDQTVISEPSSLEQEAAGRWHALTAEEKQRVRAELDRPAAGPMVSDIVIEQRR